MKQTDKNKFQILCVTMNQIDFSKIKDMNINSNIIFANQSNKVGYSELKIKNHIAKMITTNTKGVGINRNIALSYADAEICLFADDDVIYFDNLEDIILKEFVDYPSADVIIFHLESNSNERKLAKYSKTRRWKKYEPRPWGAVRIAFRLRAVQKANLWFSPLFGGGCVFPNGEDSMWIDSAFDANLKFYVSNKTIGYVDMSESSWFSGFDYKYFYAKGAFYQASYPRMIKIWMLYFAFRTRKMTMLTFKERLQWLEYGRHGYNSMKSYEEFKYEMK